MKKTLAILLLCFFMIPIAVNADRDLDGEVKLYSEGASVGSTLVFKYRAVCGNECDEVISYDPNVLEYSSIEASFPRWESNIASKPNVKVISDEPGILKYDYTITKNEGIENEVYSAETEILVKFKVKSIPSDGNIKITATALDDNGNEIAGLKNDLEIKAIKEEKCDCPKCEQPNDNKECNCPKEKECKPNDVWFVIGLISLIFNGLLLIFVIILLAKNINKSKYINILKNKELNKN